MIRFYFNVLNKRNDFNKVDRRLAGLGATIGNYIPHQVNSVDCRLSLIEQSLFGRDMDDFATEIQGNKGVIKVSGDLDSESSGEALRKAFNHVYDQGKRTIVLDLSGVNIINSYGIGKVLMCYKRLKAENGTLMVKPLNGFVK